MRKNIPFTIVMAGLIIYLFCAGFLPERVGTITATLICDAILILFSLAVLKKYSFASQKIFTLNKYTVIQYLTGFGLLLLMFYIGQIAGITSRKVFGDPAFESYSQVLSESEVWLSALVVLLAAPISEEMVYRGIIYQSALSLLEGRTKDADLIALLLQAMLFALSHMTVTHLAPCFAMALFNQLLLKRTKSFLYPILSHIGYNLLSMIGMPYPGWLAAPWLIAPLYIVLVGGLIYAFLENTCCRNDDRSDPSRMQQ